MTRTAIVTLLVSSLSLAAMPIFAASRLPGCARGAVDESALYSSLMPGAYLLEAYAKALLSLRNHVAAASKIRDDRPVAVVVSEQPEYKAVELVFNFHEAVTALNIRPDGVIEPDPHTSGQEASSISMPSRCVIRLTYRGLEGLDYHYVGPSAEKFISDVMFAGVYTDQTGARWQLHNGIATTPTRSYRYEFGIDLVGDAAHWKNGLLLKDKDSQETYEAYLVNGRKVEIFAYAPDENARVDSHHKRKRVWTLRRARGRE